jgi:hypothetical protein
MVLAEPAQVIQILIFQDLSFEKSRPFKLTGPDLGNIVGQWKTNSVFDFNDSNHGVVSLERRSAESANRLANVSKYL